MDPKIYGRQNSAIVDEIVAELEKRIGEMGDFADDIAASLHEYISERERTELVYQRLSQFAEDTFWEKVSAEDAFLDAVEGNDSCSEYIMEGLGGTSKSDNFFDRVRLLAAEYWSQ